MNHEAMVSELDMSRYSFNDCWILAFFASFCVFKNGSIPCSLSPVVQWRDHFIHFSHRFSMHFFVNNLYWLLLFLEYRLLQFKIVFVKIWSFPCHLLVIYITMRKALWSEKRKYQYGFKWRYNMASALYILRIFCYILAEILLVYAAIHRQRTPFWPRSFHEVFSINNTAFRSM